MTLVLRLWFFSIDRNLKS